jgi:hypothetical protein
MRVVVIFEQESERIVAGSKLIGPRGLLSDPVSWGRRRR